MHVEVINNTQFESFVSEYDGLLHYYHDIDYFKYIDSVQETHLLGLFESSELIGVTLMSSRQVLKRYRLLTSHTGPLIKDCTNVKLKFFLSKIDEYAKSKNAVELIHSPYTIYQMRDNDGEPIDSVHNNRDIVELYESLGYKHHGFKKEVSTIDLIRYQSVLNIEPDLETIKKNMRKGTKHSTNKSMEIPLEIEYLTEKDYDRFIKIYKDSETRIGFEPIMPSRLKKILKILEPSSYLTLCKINLDTYIHQLNDEINEQNSIITNINEKLEEGKNAKSLKNKKNQAQDVLNSKQKRLEQVETLKKEHGTELDLAAAQYYYNNNEMVYLFSGNYPEYGQLLGPNFLTWEMIKKAKEKGLKRFNFFGITGDFTESAQDYGVFQFKKGYNTHIEELPGKFSKVFHPLIYKIIKKLGKA